MSESDSLPPSSPTRTRSTAGRNRILLLCLLLPLCWLWMMIVHESGHVAAAWLTGGKVERVVLHPLAISRTDVIGSRSPELVVWSGPIVGSLMPLAIWLIVAASRFPVRFLLRFFAGFCLVANGGYMACGAFARVGDARELMQTGTPAWILVAFGLVTIPAGFALWNGQSSEFGIGPESRPVTSGTVWVVCALLLLTVGLEIACSNPS